MIFEYECTDCGHIGEELLRINDPRPVECPKCQHPAIHQIFSKAPGLSFKGRDWPSKEYKLDTQARKSMEQS